MSIALSIIASRMIPTTSASNTPFCFCPISRISKVGTSRSIGQEPPPGIVISPITFKSLTVRLSMTNLLPLDVLFSSAFFTLEKRS